jgi:hypothetical protein
MKIFRVYESYHSDSESGTYEYGCFSTLELAQARLAEIWAEKKYPDDAEKHDTYYMASSMGDYTTVAIDEIEVDKKTDENNCGYT